MANRRFGFVSLFFLAAVVGLAYDDYVSARQKFDQIETGRLRPGSRVTLSPRELDAYVAREAPAGVRNPRLELQAGVARGVALIDFGKVRRAQGHPPGWLMSKLLDGERPVSVTARIRSANGQATVDVQKVEISGVAIDGRNARVPDRERSVPDLPRRCGGPSLRTRPSHRPARCATRRGRCRDRQVAEMATAIGISLERRRVFSRPSRPLRRHREPPRNSGSDAAARLLRRERSI